MNKDDDYRYVKSSEGEVIERINLRPNSIDGKRWVNTKIKGNTLIVEDKWSLLPFTLPVGTNKIIGWCKDYQSDGIIYFVYNNLTWHSILRYNQKLKSIEKIFYSRPSLGFEDDIIRAFIADGMLYWCNGDQPLKSFILEYAVNYTNGIASTKSYTILGSPIDFDDVVFPMCKRPPQFAPEATYVDMTLDPLDPTLVINFNNLRRKMFQFKYRYTYLDNQESAWSPISKAALPPYEVDIEGEWNENINKNNAILVKINTGNAYVKKITLAVRECQNRAALGDFYTFYEIDKYDKQNNKLRPDNEINEYTFLNTKILENIDTEINNRYCDDIPISGSDMLLLDGKYCAVSMPVKNYDLVDVDYDLEAVETEITGSELVESGIPFYYDSSNHNYTVTITYYPNSDYYITFEDHDHVSHSYHVDSSLIAPGTSVQLAHVMAALIEADKLNVANLNSCSHVGNIITLDFNTIHPTWGTFDAFYYLGGSEEQLVTPSLKRCQYHPFVIIYNDGFGRYGIAQGDKELFSPVESCSVTNYVTCKMSINSKPPVWAVSYRIGYLPNKSYLYSLQVPYVQAWQNSNSINYPEETNPIKIKDIPTGHYLLMINQAIEQMRKTYPDSYVADYVFAEGDRVRKICSDDTYEIKKELTVNYWKSTHNPAIDDPDGTVTGWIIKENLIDADDYIELLEIYRPNVSISVADGSYNNVFYETGDEYEIYDAGLDTRRHGITKYGINVDSSVPGILTQNLAQVLDVNNNPLTPATLYLWMADVYIRGRMGVNPNDVPHAFTVEDMHYTDFFTSSGISIGRVTAKIDSEQKELNSIVRGEQFIEGTLTNMLNVFLFSAVHFDASDIYGRITGIEEMGGTLKVMQGHKEGSIMIGQVTMKQADFGDWIFIGDNVFGAYRRYEEDRGTTYRRSLAVNNRYCYYFDESTGEFIRSSPNGQMAISKEYDMQAWFEKKAKQLREYSGDKDVVVSFDNDYQEVIISFRIGNTNETLVFSEKEDFKGWSYFGTYYGDKYVPENFAFYKDTLISFVNGNLYLHGSGLLNTFYGMQHPCSITFVCNTYSPVVKRWSSVKYISDKNLWYTEFNIAEGLNYPAQKSRLVPAIMREKENALYSDILRNIINRNGTEDISIIHDGTRLVGDVLEITLSDATGDDVDLGSAQVNFLIAK